MKQIVLKIFSVTALAGAFFYSGTLWSKSQTKLSNDVSSEEVQDLVELYGLVESKYLDPIDMTSVVEAGLGAMASSLNDPYSFALDSATQEQLEALQEGLYLGLGLSFIDVDGVPTVVLSILDSPAYQAGIREGMQVISINDTDIPGMSKQEFQEALRVSEGEDVVLALELNGEVTEYQVKAEKFLLKTAYYINLQNGLGYLRVMMFGPQTSLELEKIFAQVEADNVRGLVLDLRGNGGGLDDPENYLLNSFLSEGVLYSEEIRSEEKKVYQAKEMTLFPDMELIAIVDRGTASFAEVITAALQENNRATIIGETTFGKATVWQPFELPSGKVVNLTVGRKYSPKGNYWHGVGITPDIVYEKPWNDDGQILELAVDVFREE